MKTLGWKGINIDPNPTTIDLFSIHRPKDLNILCGIGVEDGYGAYQQAVAGQICARGSLVQKHYDSSITCNVGKLSDVHIHRLEKILRAYDWGRWGWGLLNVDIEGAEIEVLKSFCWEEFRPMLISVEENNREHSIIDPFLQNKGYKLIAECHLTKIYIDVKSIY